MIEEEEEVVEKAVYKGDQSRRDSDDTAKELSGKAVLEKFKLGSEKNALICPFCEVWDA